MKRISIIAMLAAGLVMVGTAGSCNKGGHEDPPVIVGPDGPDTPVSPDKPDEPDNITTEGYAKGILLEEFTENFSDGKKCLGFVVTADLNANSKLRFHPVWTADKQTPIQQFETFKKAGKGTPYIVTNGGYFYTESLSLLIEDSKVKSVGVQQDAVDWNANPVKYFYPVRAALGQMEDGSFEATWTYNTSSTATYSYPSPLGNNEKTGVYMSAAPTANTQGAKPWNPVSAIGGGPMLLYKGADVWEDSYWREVLDKGGTAGFSRQPRTAVGVTKDKKVIVLVCDGRGKRGSNGYTLGELTAKMKALGCWYAINLDGGGSSCIVGKDGAILNLPCDSEADELTPGVTLSPRKVPTAIVISEE